jgi:hypothetical protein
VVGKGEFNVMPPWMIEELNKAEKEQKERMRREEANRPRVYAPEPARPAPKSEEPSNRGVYTFELGAA